MRLGLLLGFVLGLEWRNRNERIIISGRNVAPCILEGDIID